MTSTLSRWLTIGFIVLFVAGWAVAIIYIGKASKADQTMKNNATTVKAATKIVQKASVDTFGRIHTRTEVQPTLSSTQLKNEKLPGWADTAARGLDNGVQYKQQLEEQTRINITLKDSLLKAKMSLNVAKQQVFFYKNKFINLQYTRENSTDTTDHGTFSYHYNANLITTAFRKKSWFLGPKHYYLDFSTDDKNMTINSVDHYQVMEPEQWFSFHLKAGARYSFMDRTVVPVLGARFDFGRTSFTGAAIYNPSINRFNYAVGAFYDLLKF